jgi:hypothetical protein
MIEIRLLEDLDLLRQVYCTTSILPNTSEAET